MKRTIRGLAVSVVSVLALSALTGCSGESEKEAAEPEVPGEGTEYCKLLGTDFASVFAEIQGPEDVTKAVGMIEDVAAAAPDEVKGDWEKMNRALGGMEDALVKAAELQKQAEAGEVTRKKLERESKKLMKSMEALNTPENNRAGDAVAKHAGDYCGIKLD